jgi:hypothetical protein
MTMRFCPSRIAWPGALLGALVAACGTAPVIQEVTVRAHDYAFEGPDSLAAGQVAFAFENLGRVRHEVKVIGLKPGATLAQVLRLAKADSSFAHLVEPTSGILTANAGATTPGRVLVNLVAGRAYVLLCGFQDSDSAPTHDQLGMVHEIRVY